MRRIITLLLLLLTFLCKAQVTVDWYNYPGGVSIATDQSNNVYTANWDYNPAGDITLTKRNSAGSILWNVSYDNTDNTRHEVATWVETDNIGNVLVSGTIRSGFSNPVNAASILMKYSPAGVLLWRVVYESSFDGSSTTKCLVDANNNIYVLGLGTGPNGQVTKVKKFNSSGVSVWNYFDSGIGAPITFKFTPDNKILIVHRAITGSINGFSKIDFNGSNIWSIGGIASLSIGDAAGDAFGNTYIINGANPGSILKKLSPTGTVIWSQSNSFNGNKVEVGSDNNPVIGGYPGVGYGVAFMKYDFNGNFLWQNLDADGPGLSLLALAPMKLDGNNSAYLAGSTMSQMGVCKVNSDGSSAWAITTPSGYPVCLDIGADNNVYVTGGTTAKLLQPASPCITPTGLTTINITSNKARLKWSAVAGAVQYEIRYKKASSTKWSKRLVKGIYKTVDINNLTCNTSYEWKIRTLCDTVGVDIASSFSSTVNFSTGVCRISEASVADDKNILQVNPNPFSDITTLSIYNDNNADCVIFIFDQFGRLVKEINSLNLEPGLNKISLDLSDLKAGFYFCCFQSSKNINTIKLVKN